MFLTVPLPLRLWVPKTTLTSPLENVRIERLSVDFLRMFANNKTKQQILHFFWVYVIYNFKCIKKKNLFIVKLNSLIITVRSSEDKVVADEGASTVVSISGLHWGHIQHLVAWSNLPMYDFSPKCWKHEMNELTSPCRLEKSSQIKQLTILSETCQSMKEQKLLQSTHHGGRSLDLVFLGCQSSRPLFTQQ